MNDTTLKKKDIIEHHSTLGDKSHRVLKNTSESNEDSKENRARIPIDVVPIKKLTRVRSK